MPPSAILVSVRRAISSGDPAALERVAPQAEFEFERVREFRRAAEAAFDVVERLRQFAQRGGKWRTGHLVLFCGRGQRASERFEQRRVLFQDVVALLVISGGDFRQQVPEPGHAVTRGLGEIGAAEKRRAVRASGTA